MTTSTLGSSITMVIDWLLTFVVLWISVGTVATAICWGLATTLRRLFPDWWRRVVVDEEPKVK